MIETPTPKGWDTSPLMVRRGDLSSSGLEMLKQANCAQTLSGGTGISGGAPTIRSFGWNEGSELEPNMTWIRVSNRDVTDKKTHRTWENHKGIGGGRFEVFDGLEDSKPVVSFT